MIDWFRLIDLWRMAEVLGVWLAAFATFYAARVALRIASRSTTIELEVAAGPLQLMPGFDGSDCQDVFLIQATNVGLRSAVITGIYKEARFPRSAAFLTQGVMPNASVPCTLSDGESTRFVYPKELNRNWYNVILSYSNSLPRWRRKLSARSIKFYLTVSTGQKFYARISKEFYTECYEAIEAGS